MEIRVPYGTSTSSAVLPAGVSADVIDLPEVGAAADPDAAVRAALDAPLGRFDWSTCSGAASVVVAINDKTRPVPHHHLLPPLLAELRAAGVADEAITFVVAVGGHPPMHESEFDSILPTEVHTRYSVRSHDADRPDLVDLGATSRGTPVRVDRGFATADVKIVVGTVEPHQFVGFSGGVKTAAIGLAGRETIDANHTLMTHPSSVVATYDGNPAREDVEEIGRLIGVDLALNVTLDRHRAITRVLAGDPVAVMETAVPLVRQEGLVAVPRRYPVVVTSPGGHPKDVDVYQSQKAVASAARVVEPGGTMILTAACPDGAGNAHYEDWVAARASPAEVRSAFAAEGFRLGPHKAFQLARDTEHAQLAVCSEMPDDVVRRLLLDPAPDLQHALDAAIAATGTDTIAVLPRATSTVPYLAAS